MDTEQASIVEINEMALDRECYRQPRLVMDYGLQLAEAKKEFAESKADLEALYAQLELEIRADPEAFDLLKPTEAAIKATILTHSKYQRATKRNIHLKFIVDQLTVVMTALDHRKSALETATKLHGQNYFSQPVLSSSEEQDKMNKRTVRNKAKIKRNGS